MTALRPVCLPGGTGRARSECDWHSADGSANEVGRARGDCKSGTAGRGDPRAGEGCNRAGVCLPYPRQADQRLAVRAVEVAHIASADLPEVAKSPTTILGVLSSIHSRKLLPLCQHVRTPRLFAWSARRYGHRWLGHARLEAVDLGTGKRQAVPGGALDSEFRITVPKGMGRTDADG